MLGRDFGDLFRMLVEMEEKQKLEKEVIGVSKEGLSCSYTRLFEYHGK